MNPRRINFALGLIFWTAMLLWLGNFLTPPSPETDHASSSKPNDETTTTAETTSGTPLKSISQFVFNRAETVTIKIAPNSLQVGDPVFIKRGLAGDWSNNSAATKRRNSTSINTDTVLQSIIWDSGQMHYRQVGYVVQVNEDIAFVQWYDPELSPQDCDWVQHQTSQALSDVVETLLPPKKRQQIALQITAAMSQHGQQVSDAMIPLIQQTVEESMPIIEDEFKKSMERHSGELRVFSDRWKNEWLKERFVPLARSEILPIVRQHAEPAAEKIGREIWDRASLWRFGWRAVYDTAPLPKRNLVRSEWKRFVDEEALPVIERNLDIMVVAIENTAKEIADNDKVRQEFGTLIEGVATDPESRRLVSVLLKESLIENKRLHQAWRDVWESPEAKASLRQVSERVEPVVRSIGDQIFGSREHGIEPNFARVLRSQILRKDRRWLIASPIPDQQLDALTKPETKSPIQVTRAKKSMVYPVIYIVQDRTD